MKRVKLPMLLLVLLILTGCAPSEAPKPTQAGDGADGSETGASTIPGVASGFLSLSGSAGYTGSVDSGFIRDSYAFSLNRIEQLGNDWTGAVSPAALSMALQMATLGADSEALSAMQTAMCTSLSAEDLAKNNAALLNAFDKISGIRMANAVILDKRYALASEFSRMITDYYSAQTGTFDFSDTEKLVSVINNWVSDKTNGRIDRLFDSVMRDSVMYLLSAIDFDMKWKIGFDSAKTISNAVFYGASGKSDADMMYGSGEYKYAELDEGCIVLIPYEGDEFYMAVMLPKDKNVAPAQFMKKAIYELDKCVPEQANIWLPKLSIQTHLDLCQQLSAMGMGDALMGGSGSFPSLLSGTDESTLQIGQIATATNMNINEDGTQASGAAGVGIAKSSMAMTENNIRCDRPFAVAVIHADSGAALFMATINDIE